MRRKNAFACKATCSAVATQVSTHRFVRLELEDFCSPVEEPAALKSCRCPLTKIDVVATRGPLSVIAAACDSLSLPDTTMEHPQVAACLGNLSWLSTSSQRLIFVAPLVLEVAADALALHDALARIGPHLQVPREPAVRIVRAAHELAVTALRTRHEHVPEDDLSPGDVAVFHRVLSQVLAEPAGALADSHYHPLDDSRLLTAQAIQQAHRRSSFAVG